MHVHVCITSLKDVFLQLFMRIIYLSRLKRTMTVSHDHGSHETLELSSGFVNGLGLRFLVTIFAEITKKLAEYP